MIVTTSSSLDLERDDRQGVSNNLFWGISLIMS